MFEQVCKMLAEQLGIDASVIKPESEVVKDGAGHRRHDE